ncbi:MAG: hypothetical protein U1F50_06885 [Rubrivivax sp.]
MKYRSTLAAVAPTLAAPARAAWPGKSIRRLDDRPGAGGTLCGAEVVRLAPGGYTPRLSNPTPPSTGPFTLPEQPCEPGWAGPSSRISSPGRSATGGRPSRRPM